MICNNILRQLQRLNKQHKFINQPSYMEKMTNKVMNKTTNIKEKTYKIVDDTIEIFNQLSTIKYFDPIVKNKTAALATLAGILLIVGVFRMIILLIFVFTIYLIFS